MHREPSASRGRMKPKSKAKDAPNLQPKGQEQNDPAEIEKSIQQPPTSPLLKLLLVLNALGWLGQTWPGLKELARDFITFLTPFLIRLISN